MNGKNRAEVSLQMPWRAIIFNHPLKLYIQTIYREMKRQTVFDFLIIIWATIYVKMYWIDIFLFNIRNIRFWGLTRSMASLCIRHSSSNRVMILSDKLRKPVTGMKLCVHIVFIGCNNNMLQTLFMRRFEFSRQTFICKFVSYYIWKRIRIVTLFM